MRCASLLVVLAALAAPAAAQTGESFDVIIRGGRVLDGTGNPWYPADIGISGERITAIGDLSRARAGRVILAEGRYVTPGFIALHEHIERGILAGDGRVTNYTTQGFTTAVVNADGRTMVWPIRLERDSLKQLGHALNLVLMVGHGTVRTKVMGERPDQVMREATAEEVTRMQELVRQGMEDGAFGLSTGLEYAPMRYSSTEELVSLASVVAQYGGHVQAHMRSQGRYPKWQLPSHMDHPTRKHVDWMDAIQEGITVARRTGVPFWFDHIHPKGPREWGVSKPTVEAIGRAWDEGLQVYTNMHSYDGYQESVTLVPRWALVKQEVPGMSMSDDFPPADYGGMKENLERNLSDPARRAMMETDVAYEVDRQGGAEGLLIVDFPEKSLVGKTLADVAKEKQLSTFDAVIWLARNGYPNRRGGVGWMMLAIGMVDIEEWMRHDWNGVSLDRGWDEGEGCDAYTHPGTYGTSGRLLRYFVMERGTITLPFAIRSLTSAGAQALGLADRGLLREGMLADVVVFDPATIRSDATYLNPCVPQQGISHVLVNGQLVVDDGKPTDRLPGRVLDRQRPRTTGRR
ncbi:MAG TPA: amidohydrolase family protein [Gemmatimonadales bacterium]|nr:amidohydrolase family protein [Gemmatimonadales bacterium]